MDVTKVQNLVGQPKYVYDTEKETWVPPVKQKLYSPNDLYNLFRKESILFIGEGWQRNAADMLHIEINYNRNNPKKAAEPPSLKKKAKIYHWHRYKAKCDNYRVIDEEIPYLHGVHDDIVKCDSKNQCLQGCIDNSWLTSYEEMSERLGSYTNHDYSIIVFGIEGNFFQPKDEFTTQEFTTQELRTKIQETIKFIHDQFSSTNVFQIYWKSIGYCPKCTWQEDEKSQLFNNNYMIYVANQAAKEYIASLDDESTNQIKYLDWAREMLPHYSQEKSGKRLNQLLLQMLANDVDTERRKRGGGRSSSALVNKMQENIQANRKGGDNDIDSGSGNYHQDNNNNNPLVDMMQKSIEANRISITNNDNNNMNVELPSSIREKKHHQYQKSSSSSSSGIYEYTTYNRMSTAATSRDDFSIHLIGFFCVLLVAFLAKKNQKRVAGPGSVITTTSTTISNKNESVFV